MKSLNFAIITLALTTVSATPASAAMETIYNLLGKKSGSATVRIVPGSIVSKNGFNCLAKLEVTGLAPLVSLTDTGTRNTAEIGMIRYCGEKNMPNIDATVALFKGVDSLPVTVESELYERIFVMPENPGTPEGPQCARQIIENVTFKFAGQDGAVSLPGGGYEIPGLPNPESCHDLNSNK